MMFEKDYYVRSNISNYEDYRKKKFDQIALELKDYFKWNEDTRILDYGAATGGLLSTLKDIGIKNIVGTDISYWAINFGRKRYSLSNRELQHYNRQLLEERFDYIIMLDILEHIYTDELYNTLAMINTDNVLVRIPVAMKEGDDFALEISRHDKTHVQCHDKQWWISLFSQYNYKLHNTITLSTIYDSEGVFVGLFKRN